MMNDATKQTSPVPPVGPADEARPLALLVDGDALILEQCEPLLQEEGFTCVAAGSGETAMALLDSRPFDLLLLDVLMPGASVQTIIAHARRARSQPAIAVMTALADRDARVQELRAEGVPVLLKPIDASDLGHTVAWISHQRHLLLRGLPPSDLLALYRIAAAANREAMRPQLLDRVLAIAIAALGGDSGAVMLSSAASVNPRTLTIAASHGLVFDPVRAGVEFGLGVAGWVAAHARPLRLVGSLDAYPQFRGITSNPSRADSLVAPIIFRREVLGVISINSGVPDRFGPERLALLVSIAEVLAAGLHRDYVERAREHHDRLAMLGQLAASIAHELNNPLTVLKGNAQALAWALFDDPGSPVAHAPELHREARGMMSDISDAADRMVSLVAPLRATSRKPTAEARDLDLDLLMARAEVLVTPQFKHRVALSVERGAPPPVKADAARITQVLINLLVNASQAVGKNGRVTLRSRAEGSSSVVEVEDNGPGIPEEVAAQLFEPFFTTKPEGEGTGLGLSISRQIAREYGGDLTFRTRVGAGTCFMLKLPAAAADSEIARPTALVVEDEPTLLRATERVLKGRFTVLAAASPEEALAIARAHATEIDLVLTDYSMPGQTGVALVKALRELGITAPAALVTAVSEHAEIQEALHSGLLVKVIPKPWNAATLAAEAFAMVH